MKRVFACILAALLLLGGCSGAQMPTEPATEPRITLPPPPTEPTQETEAEEATQPTTEPAPVYFNPLNGTILEEPFTGRIFANTVSNVPYAVPHVGVNQADILMEMYGNGSVIRCLALFTDITQVESIGSTRSTRLMFNDIVQHYDAILSHAGYDYRVGQDAKSRGIDHFNIDAYTSSHNYSFRDPDRKKSLGYEHSLMGYGPGIYEYAQAQGLRLTQPADKDYFLRFADDGTPQDGEDAQTVRINITYSRYHKETVMVYDAELGKYVFNQYGKEMADGVTGEKEAFENVIVMYASIGYKESFQVADFLAGGTGYFACGGRIVPIRWECDAEDQPFRFLNMDGSVLELGRGNTYIAVCQDVSEVSWSGGEA